MNASHTSRPEHARRARRALIGWLGLVVAVVGVGVSGPGPDRPAPDREAPARPAPEVAQVSPPPGAAPSPRVSSAGSTLTAPAARPPLGRPAIRLHEPRPNATLRDTGLIYVEGAATGGERTLRAQVRRGDRVAGGGWLRVRRADTASSDPEWGSFGGYLPVYPTREEGSVTLLLFDSAGGGPPLAEVDLTLAARAPVLLWLPTTRRFTAFSGRRDAPVGCPRASDVISLPGDHAPLRGLAGPSVQRIEARLVRADGSVLALAAGMLAPTPGFGWGDRSAPGWIPFEAGVSVPTGTAPGEPLCLVVGWSSSAGGTGGIALSVVFRELAPTP